MQIIDAKARDLVPVAKKPKRYNLGRQLFKRPVKVALQAETAALGQLIETDGHPNASLGAE
jgi:small nuclear ribonucleoprotein (snRNP)-like protein